jgi:adenylate kinase
MEKIVEVNCETGEVIERELTADEAAQRKIDAANEIARTKELAKAEAEAIAAKEAAEAKLAALGLTADDLKALGL